MHLDLRGSVVQSQHAIGETRKRITVYHIPVLVNTIRPSGLSWCVHSAHGVCVVQNTLVVCLFVCGHKNEQFE